MATTPTTTPVPSSGFPEVVNPTLPPDTESLALGAGRIRALTQLVADVLGLPLAPTPIVAPAFAITTQGVVQIAQPGATVVADPTVPLGIATKQYADGAAYGVRTIAVGQNAYSATLPAAQGTAVNAGNIPVAVGFAAGSTGACTLSINGGPAWQIVRPAPYGLGAGDITGGQWMWLIFDGSWWTIMGGNFFPQTGGWLSGYIGASQVLASTGPNSLTGITYTNTVEANHIDVSGDVGVSGQLIGYQNVYAYGNIWTGGGGVNTLSGTTNATVLNVYQELVTAANVATVLQGPTWAQQVYVPAPTNPSSAINKNYYDSRTPVVGWATLGSPVNLPANNWAYLCGFSLAITPPFDTSAYGLVYGIISVAASGVSANPAVYWALYYNGNPIIQSAPITVHSNWSQIGVLMTPVGLGGGAGTYQLFALYTTASGTGNLTVSGPTFIEAYHIGH